MKVLYVSTWKQRCGIADFAQSMVESLAGRNVTSEVFPLNTAALRYATSAELRAELDRCVRMAAGFDLVHIQHEFVIFAGAGGLFESIWNFTHLLAGLRAAGRPVVVTFHSEPAFQLLVPAPQAGQGASGGLSGLHSLVQRLRTRRVIGKLRNLWRASVGPHFNGQPGSFRGLVHTPRTRLGLVNSGLAPECVSVMPLGHALRDASFLSIDRTQAKASLGLRPDSILSTIFGFVTAYKGHLVAVQALKKLPPQHHLAIVGGPNLANHTDTTLNAILAMWENEDPRRLMITGFASRETIDRYHAASDICLAPFLPGNTAGSASATWAFTSGKPTIASNIPAFAEIQEAADCLLLCTPNAHHELAWHIQQLAGNLELQDRLSQRALKFAAENSWECVCERLIGVYRELIQASGIQFARPMAQFPRSQQAA
ncbi:MAG TPA: glycosyltransferase [Planctomycetaceae bacterium]|nr:glycosyltransferase [Planctomycetaceae bacterium]